MAMVRGSVAKTSVATIVVAADGSGDYTDIQKGIDALPSGGGVVYIREGTYTVTSTITITISNVSLIGAGYSTFIDCSNIKLFDLSSVDHLTFEGIRFKFPTSGTATNHITLGNCDSCRLTNCWLEGGTNSQLVIGDSSKTQITNCEFSDGGAQASIFITTVSSELCSEIIIAHNIIRDCSSDGIFMNPIATSTIKNNIIVGNLIYDNGDYGIDSSIGGSGTLERCIVTNNYVRGNTTGQIRLEGTNHVNTNNITAL